MSDDVSGPRGERTPSHSRHHPHAEKLVDVVHRALANRPEVLSRKTRAPQRWVVRGPTTFLLCTRWLICHRRPGEKEAHRGSSTIARCVASHHPRRTSMGQGAQPEPTLSSLRAIPFLCCAGEGLVLVRLVGVGGRKVSFFAGDTAVPPPADAAALVWVANGAWDGPLRVGRRSRRRRSVNRSMLPRRQLLFNFYFPPVAAPAASQKKTSFKRYPPLPPQIPALGNCA